jgi:CDP-diacylglycerol---serine O-phosphatidyltransferase
MRAHIPNLITSANLICGVVAALFAISGDLVIAALFMAIGMVFDFFDGLVARWLKVQGPLGVQLDSMADLITFGLAPSLVLMQLMQMSFYGEIKPLTEVFTARAWQVGLDSYYPFLALLVVVASAFRLAKFNIDTRQTTHFIGLPTPANAMMIASLPLIFEYHYTPELEEVVFNKWFLIGLTLFSTYALNAPWSLFSLKFSSLTWKANKHLFVLLGAAIVLISGLGYRAIPLILLVYIVMSLAWKKQWLQQPPL